MTGASDFPSSNIPHIGFSNLSHVQGVGIKVVSSYLYYLPWVKGIGLNGQMD